MKNALVEDQQVVFYGIYNINEFLKKIIICNYQGVKPISTTF